jgi:hypothetical protein
LNSLRGLRQRGFGSSVVEHRDVELAKVIRVGDRIDRHDLALGDREIEDGARLPADDHEQSHRSVYERRLSCPRTALGPIGVMGRPSRRH